MKTVDLTLLYLNNNEVSPISPVSFLVLTCFELPTFKLTVEVFYRANPFIYLTFFNTGPNINTIDIKT